MVLDAAMAAIQSAMREVPDAGRAEAFDRLHVRLEWFEEFLTGLGRPAEGQG
jgi:hypothetical protein